MTRCLRQSFLGHSVLQQLLVVWLGWCLLALPAQAEDLPGHLQVGQQRLVLNGSGARTKAFIEMYKAGLYLTQPTRDANAVIASDQPMALRIKITSGFVSQSSLVESLEEGFKNATGGDVREIRPQIDQFRGLFKDEIQKGDTFDMVYMPQHGVILNKNGKYLGSVAGAKFKQALFSIWLCDKPADSGLKQALLTPAKVR